jgi:hypothetical protein
MRVFITGGTGLVGSRLAARLIERGDTAVVLSRNRSAGAQFGAGAELVEGDPTTTGAWQQAIDGCDAVVNLAGENIFARRWNDEFKARIQDSRVNSTRQVVAAIARAGRKPAVLVNASAIGYYGPRGDEEITETAAAGDDFLAHACVAWEAAAREMMASEVRTAILRIGVVLATNGGALAQMLTPFKLGVGGPVGNGRQWMPWIHIDDLASLFLFAIDNHDVSDVLNATAPEPVTNREFSKALGRALGRPAIFPVPVFMLRFRFGQVADVISTGARVLPSRAIGFGFTFRFSRIDDALVDLLRH